MKPFKESFLLHFCISVLSLLLLVSISCLSYFYYERPFLALKKRFSPRAVSLTV
jgi:peptidoglycan/LPS O-acetylase OafA/YrhL